MCGCLEGREGEGGGGYHTRTASLAARTSVTPRFAVRWAAARRCKRAHAPRCAPTGNKRLDPIAALPAAPLSTPQPPGLQPPTQPAEQVQPPVKAHVALLGVRRMRPLALAHARTRTRVIAARRLPRASSMRRAAHDIQRATLKGSTRNMHHTSCNIQHARCNIQRTTCNIHHATCTIQRATCNIQLATCNMKRARALTRRSRCSP